MLVWSSEEMASCCGIYFGATSVCLALHKDGKTDVVANDAGDRVTPAMVAYVGKDKNVGLGAKQGRIRNAANTIMNVKHIIGKYFDDPFVQTLVKTSPCKIINKRNLPLFEVESNEKTIVVTPEEVLVLIFKKMYSIASSQGGLDVMDVVLTIPTNFTGEQSNTIRKAASAAGFKVCRIINEPSAAALAYDIGQDTSAEISNVLVYRLGGTSLSVVVLNVNSGMYRILESHNQVNCGGTHFTNSLVEICADEFKRSWRADVRENKRGMAKLANACETCKHVLSTLNSASTFVESVHEGIDFQNKISRAKLESLIQSHLQMCLQPVDKVLESANMTAADIHKVVVVGGSTRIPKLQQLLRAKFPEAEMLNTLAPEEVIAIGAAKQAALISGYEDIQLLDLESVKGECIPYSLLVKVSNSDETSLQTAVPKNTYIPVRRQHTYTIQQDKSSVCIGVYVGEEGSTEEECTLVANLVLTDLPTDCQKEKQVTTVFHYRREGSIHITCTEVVSGKSSGVTIETGEPAAVEEPSKVVNEELNSAGAPEQ
ncbi:heat shock 70 kDa protein 14-like [Anneissia japonica]|uniref:heat shock 70 kDa protein 14-like n=1 Tax=Anneissia japonica TaxID=1529436 RepID=UPI001425B74C|nr:heat shock 70 kDa protein 14-like [Anneissia japonica]